MERRFLRKANDKVFGGVCSGLADYVGFDTSLVRLVTLIAIIASGVLPGLFFYFLCVIIVPYDTQASRDSYRQDDSYTNDYDSYQAEGSYGYPRNRTNSRMVIGIILIALGVIFFARMFFGWLDWRYVFAGFLILFGIYMLFGSKRQ